MQLERRRLDRPQRAPIGRPPYVGRVTGDYDVDGPAGLVDEPVCERGRVAPGHRNRNPGFFGESVEVTGQQFLDLGRGEDFEGGRWRLHAAGGQAGTPGYEKSLHAASTITRSRPADLAA